MKTFPYRLAAIDLDGTLLGPDSRVGPVNRAAVDRLRAAGVIPIIASGRMHAATLAIHDDLGLDSPVVSYNGALVVDPPSGETFLHTTLDAAIAAELAAWGHDAKLHLQYYLDDRLYVERKTPMSDLYHARTGSIIHPVGPLTQFAGKSPTKIILVAEPEETLHWQAYWRERLGDRCYIVRTMPEYLEFINPAANKWTGIREVAHRYGISDAEVMAFGDSPNDVPMLDGAGLGVVMPYAAAEVLAAADLVGKGTPEDAFGRTVERLLAGDYPAAGLSRPGPAQTLTS